MCVGYNAKVYLHSVTLIQGLSTEYMMLTNISLYLFNDSSLAEYIKET